MRDLGPSVPVLEGTCPRCPWQWCGEVPLAPREHFLQGCCLDVEDGLGGQNRVLTCDSASGPRPGKEVVGSCSCGFGGSAQEGRAQVGPQLCVQVPRLSRPMSLKGACGEASGLGAPP